MVLLVCPDTVSATQGTLRWSGGEARCALGWSGITDNKQEGDGATPLGTFPLRRVFYRPDRLSMPHTALQVIPLTETSGWCDDPASPAYNTLVDLPFSGSHEVMWRNDEAYDVVVELGYNDAPAVPGRGSAIFLHVQKDNFSPTEGCVAIDLDVLVQILSAVSAGESLSVIPPQA